jgi:hypothetical protein
VGLVFKKKNMKAEGEPLGTQDPWEEGTEQERVMGK